MNVVTFQPCHQHLEVILKKEKTVWSNGKVELMEAT